MLFPRRVTTLIVGAFALLWACGRAETSPVSQARSAADEARPQPEGQVEDGPLVVFLGDSIAAGLHLSKDEAFPAVLQRQLATSGAPFRLLNAGVSGDTSAGGLRRLDWLLKQDPDGMVVELGNNDGLRGQALETIEANLRAILQRLADEAVPTLLLGGEMPPNYGEEYTAGFRELFAKLAREFDVAFVPFFLEGVGGVAELNLPDGLHPTAEGHEHIAEKLNGAMREFVLGLE